MKFLEQINRHANGELTEGIWDAVKAAHAAGKAAMAPPPPAPPNPHDTADKRTLHVVDGLEDFAHAVQNVADAKNVRVIMFCRKSWFAGAYLTSGDGSAIIKEIEDTDFNIMFSYFLRNYPKIGSDVVDLVAGGAGRNFALRAIPGVAMSLDEQIKNSPMGDVVVFLEIPKSQFAKLKAAVTDEDKRKSFGHLFNHHFYMFAVFTTAAKSLPPYTGDSGTPEPITGHSMQIIDPKILAGHKTMGQIKKLQAEWNEVWSPDAKIKKTKDEGDAAVAAADEADNKKIGADTAKNKLKTDNATSAAELARATPPAPVPGRTAPIAAEAALAFAKHTTAVNIADAIDAKLLLAGAKGSPEYSAALGELAAYLNSTEASGLDTSIKGAVKTRLGIPL